MVGKIRARLTNKLKLNKNELETNSAKEIWANWLDFACEPGPGNNK